MTIPPELTYKVLPTASESSTWREREDAEVARKILDMEVSSRVVQLFLDERE